MTSPPKTGSLRSAARRVTAPGRWLRTAWLRSAARIPALARLHYLLFSGAFNRELQAVLAGHIRFESNRSNSEPVNYFLRRAIHRIEKGLIMRPVRESFATDYIEDTVTCYLSGEGIHNSAEATWARNVLEAYFRVARGHPAIERARQRFEQGAIEIDASEPSTGASAPFARGDETSPPVGYEALKALSVRRRSVRWYRQEPVPRSAIDQAIAVASLAPSACNRQPFEYRIFDDPEAIAQVARLPMGIKGYEHNIPALAVLVGKLRAYPHPRDRHVIYIDAALSAMSFMYALETLGLSSCPINWPDIPSRERAMARLLSLQPDERVVMLVSMGYADPEGLIPGSVKVPVAALRSYNDPLRTR